MGELVLYQEVDRTHPVAAEGVELRREMRAEGRSRTFPLIEIAIKLKEI